MTNDIPFFDKPVVWTKRIGPPEECWCCLDPIEIDDRFVIVRNTEGSLVMHHEKCNIELEEQKKEQPQ